MSVDESRQTLSPQQLLQRHGAEAEASDLIARAGHAIREQARATGLEHAASFDLASGSLVGPLRSGHETDVDIAEQIAAMPADRRHICVHTHRLSTSFSDMDVALLLVNIQVHTIAAIGADGRWYFLSKEPGGHSARAVTAVRAFRTAFEQMAPTYLAAAETGAFSREEALRRLLHTLWCMIAAPLHLRYDWSAPHGSWS
jgi:hypothetical protein